MPHKKRKKIRNHADEFELICRLARRCDAEGVKRILRRGNCVSLRQNRITPVMQMAIEGNDRAVWMLIHIFHASLHQVVDGYARVGRHDKVNEFVALGASPAAAAAGYLLGGFKGEAIECMLAVHGQSMSTDQQDKYRQFLHENYRDFCDQITQSLVEVAIAGRFKEVEERIARGEDVDDAIFGYAAGGHIRQVENLISRGGDRRTAMSGYADGGFLDLVRMLKQHYQIDYIYSVKSFAANGQHRYVEEIYESNHDWQHNVVSRAAEGYKDAGYFQNETIAVRLLASIRLDDLRNKLASEAVLISGGPGSYVKLNARSLLKKAERIRNIMREFHVNFDQAVVMRAPGLITWLLQGQSLRNLSRDMYLQIAAKIANTTYDDIKIIAAAVAKNTHDGAVKKIEYKHAPGFFQRWGICAYDEKIAQKKIQEDIRELDLRYLGSERRVGFS